MCSFQSGGGTGSSRPLHQTPARYQLIRVSKLITTGIKKQNTRLTMICNHGYEVIKYPFIIIIFIITALICFEKKNQIIA